MLSHAQWLREDRIQIERRTETMPTQTCVETIPKTGVTLEQALEFLDQMDQDIRQFDLDFGFIPKAIWPHQTTKGNNEARKP